MKSRTMNRGSVRADEKELAAVKEFDELLDVDCDIRCNQLTRRYQLSR